MRKITSIILLICLLMSCCMAVTARTSEAEILRIDEKNNTRYIVPAKMEVNTICRVTDGRMFIMVFILMEH